MKTKLPIGSGTKEDELFFDVRIDNHSNDIIGTLIMSFTYGTSVRRLKADIRRNSYDFQSWGSVSLFSESVGQWNELHKTQIEDLPIMGYRDNGAGTQIQSYLGQYNYTDYEWASLCSDMWNSLDSLLEIGRKVLR
tara:strand:+ start:3072 stop:3479 length:408 start_codon:yes stop_codon:yes gene_type:complete